MGLLGQPRHGGSDESGQMKRLLQRLPPLVLAALLISPVGPEACLNPYRCEGSPTRDCWEYSADECPTRLRCGVEVTCNPVHCPDLSAAQCGTFSHCVFENDVCFFNFDDYAPKPCSYSTQLDCQGDASCVWGDFCRGSVISCFDLSEDSCETVDGCEWRKGHL